MPDAMGAVDTYQSFQDLDLCAIAKVEVESLPTSTFDLVGDEGLPMAGSTTATDFDSKGSRLPPGYRFHPTDEELVTYYLAKKVSNKLLSFEAIDEVNLNKCEPWDLPAKAKVAENAWYFFSLRDRKYPTGMRTNRATLAGYWKATGKDKEVMSSDSERLVGMKKTLVFYLGRAPRGEKTNWIMHEYRIEGNSSPATEWVVCRVFKKNPACKKAASAEGLDHPGSSSYQLEVDDHENDTSSFEQPSSTYLPLLTDSPHHQSPSHIMSSNKLSMTSSNSMLNASGPVLISGSSITLGSTYPSRYLGTAIDNTGNAIASQQMQQPLRTYNVNDNSTRAIRREMHGMGNSLEDLLLPIQYSDWDFWTAG